MLTLYSVLIPNLFSTPLFLSCSHSPSISPSSTHPFSIPLYSYLLLHPLYSFPSTTPPLLFLLLSSSSIIPPPLITYPLFPLNYLSFHSSLFSTFAPHLLPFSLFSFTSIPPPSTPPFLHPLLFSLQYSPYTPSLSLFPLHSSPSLLFLQYSPYTLFHSTPSPPLLTPPLDPSLPFLSPPFSHPLFLPYFSLIHYPPFTILPPLLPYPLFPLYFSSPLHSFTSPPQPSTPFLPFLPPPFSHPLFLLYFSLIHYPPFTILPPLLPYPLFPLYFSSPLHSFTSPPQPSTPFLPFLPPPFSHPLFLLYFSPIHSSPFTILLPLLPYPLFPLLFLLLLYSSSSSIPPPPLSLLSLYSSSSTPPPPSPSYPYSEELEEYNLD